MQGPQNLFRKASIERLASPEQLDTAMRVTSPVGWLALLSVGVVIVAAIAWSIVGQLSVQVDGTGIMLRGETVQSVQVGTAGKVEQLLVAKGDLVSEGQVVAHLQLTEIDAQIAATLDRIRDLRGQQQQQSGKLQGLRQSYQTQLRHLEEQLKTKQDLYRRGLARKQDVLAVEGNIANIKAQIFQTELGESDFGSAIREEQRTLKQLETNKEEGSIVTSPFSGRVSAVLADQGELIQAGSRLLNLEAEEDEPFQVLIFVPFTEGKKVAVDMEVKIAPTNVKPEEFGFIVGRIREVSPQPVTPEEVRRTLNNDQLAQKFAKDTPFKVSALPVLDAATPSGFKWTSAQGPPIEISSSTPCTARVIIERKRPISLVIPLVKKHVLGIS